MVSVIRTLRDLGWRCAPWVEAEVPTIKGPCIFILTSQELTLGWNIFATQVVGIYASLEGARAEVESAIDKANQSALSQHERLVLIREITREDGSFYQRWGSEDGAMMGLTFRRHDLK